MDGCAEVGGQVEWWTYLFRVYQAYFSQINIKENFKALLLRGRTKFKIKWKEKLGNKIALGC